MESEYVNKQLELLKERLPYDKDIFETNLEYEKVLSNLLEDSKYIALSLRFPFEEDYSNIPLPSKYYNWQLRCSKELYDAIGIGNFKSYSENGISWTRDSSNISSDLKSEIISKVGYIKCSTQNQ